VLAGVAPLRWAYEDVATPFEPFIDNVDPYDCTTDGPDGFMDLTLKYKTQELVEAIGEVDDGATSAPGSIATGLKLGPGRPVYDAARGNVRDDPDDPETPG
jgi:hypothetical protein